MLEMSLPGREIDLQLENLILDLNGTLTVDGVLITGIKTRLDALREILQIYLLSSDTLDCGNMVAEKLRIPFFKVSGEKSGEDKLDFLNTIGPDRTIVIGNGYNDRYILDKAALGIAVIGSEGGALKAMQKADLVVIDILDALDLLLNPLRIVASLRD